MCGWIDDAVEQDMVKDDSFGEMSYFMWAQMIRSDQMTHDQVITFMNNRPAFAEWYRENYLYREQINAL